MSVRKIKRISSSQPTFEGAGVLLKRVFGYNDLPAFDPFLLMDDFRSDNVQDYSKGFPWHPHRGIETITYVLEGEVEHKDSIGNSGIISPGDVQWMTAGSGIIHQEMPIGNKDGKMGGFQLWTNLPSGNKMMAPRYQEIKSSNIPQKIFPGGITIKIISGKINEISGPVKDILIDPEYLDITIPPNKEFIYPTKDEYTVFAYVISGKVYIPSGDNMGYGNETLVLFDEGNQVVFSTRNEDTRFLLLSGKPIKQPIAWYGPIVMNTKEELGIALEEYRNGTFIK